MLIPAQPAPAPPFSSLRSLSSNYFLLPSHSHSHSHFLRTGPGGVLLPPLRRGDLAIRMGGGPRTFPGGVSKWQWKRMQAKKARQLLKARLARERQLYEMRRRAELRDAAAHLERPWDPDSSTSASAVAPNLLSVAAEDQLRALADRFHRPGGVDLWNDRDGPRVFASPATGAASARFFPRNAFHSVQPYALASAGEEASAQGVRENAVEDEAYRSITDREPAVELTERDDGTWEPVNALADADYSTAGDWTSDDEDDDAISESEGTGDAGSWREQRGMVITNGRSGGVARWKPAGAMAADSDNDRGWSGGAFSSDSERARQVHREQRWQERSTSASPRKQGEQRAMVTRNGRSNGVARWKAAGAMGATSDNDRGWSGGAFSSDSKRARQGHQEQRWQERSTSASPRKQGEQRAMVTGNGRSNGVARWKAAGATGATSDNDRGWSGGAFSSDSERAGKDHSEQRWQERSTSASPRKQANGRWTGLKATAGSHVSQRGRTGAGSFSESEVIRGGSEPKWRASKGKRDDTRNGQRGRTGAGSFSESEVIRGGSEPKWRASKGKRDDTRNGAGRWNAPKQDWMGDRFDSNSDSARGRELEPRWNAPKQDWMGDRFDSNPDSARGRELEPRWNAPKQDWVGDRFNSNSDSARGRELEPRRGARSKMNGSNNLTGRSKPKYSANANGGEKLSKYMRGNPHANSNNGFAEDLEAPKWKPRRMNRARNNNGGRDDDMGGRSRQGEDGRKEGGRQTSRNGGRRLWGDEYSLRPTSELRGSWPEMGSDGL